MYILYYLCTQLLTQDSLASAKLLHLSTEDEPSKNTSKLLSAIGIHRSMIIVIINTISLGIRVTEKLSSQTGRSKKSRFQMDHHWCVQTITRCDYLQQESECNPQGVFMREKKISTEISRKHREGGINKILNIKIILFMHF